MTEQQTRAKTIVGKVVSDKMDKTIVVQIESKVKHPLYKKYVKRFSKMRAHDAEGKSKIGDMVAIQQTKPVSKTKTWALVEIIENSKK
jgi:small subunit ribosomal protein S17